MQPIDGRPNHRRPALQLPWRVMRVGTACVAATPVRHERGLERFGVLGPGAREPVHDALGMRRIIEAIERT